MIKGICKQCGRPVYDNFCRHGTPMSASYCYVVHDFYGCDTGCCGHIAYLCDENDNIIAQSDFNFFHPYNRPTQ